MLTDRVSNPGPLTYESGALPIALRGPAKSQTENFLKITSFFNIKVSVTEHNSLNSSKGIIRDRMLKGETEDNIVNYLRPQGLTGCKRFKIKKKNRKSVETNTLLLTFNRIQNH